MFSQQLLQHQPFSMCSLSCDKQMALFSLNKGKYKYAYQH